MRFMPGIMICLVMVTCALGVGFMNLKAGRKKFAYWQISLGVLIGVALAMMILAVVL